MQGLTDDWITYCLILGLLSRSQRIEWFYGNDSSNPSLVIFGILGFLADDSRTDHPDVRDRKTAIHRSGPTSPDDGFNGLLGGSGRLTLAKSMKGSKIDYNHKVNQQLHLY